MDRRGKRTVIDLARQPQFDFDEAQHSHSFSYPEYQWSLLPARFVAELIDFAIAGVIYTILIVATFMQMPEGAVLDRRVAGVYMAGFLVLVAVYYLLFMLSA